MCRLYALLANAPTRLDCSLVRAGNNLMRQSLRDREGFQHAHGWGLAAYVDGKPVISRENRAAFEDEGFERLVTRSRTQAAIAHVRRATVGAQSLENTHPFRHGRFSFAHNGTIPGFERIRPRLLAATRPSHRALIRGQTDSEHLFHFILSRWSESGGAGLMEAVRSAVGEVLGWSEEFAPGESVCLNVVLTNGRELVATRFGRTLWFLEHEGELHCSSCGSVHAVRRTAGISYRAIEVASEPVTPDAAWCALPEACVLGVDAAHGLRLMPLASRRAVPASERRPLPQQCAV
jgi:glutamine amidotransferase